MFGPWKYMYVCVFLKETMMIKYDKVWELREINGWIDGRLASEHHIASWTIQLSPAQYRYDVDRYQYNILHPSHNWFIYIYIWYVNHALLEDCVVAYHGICCGIEIVVNALLSGTLQENVSNMKYAEFNIRDPTMRRSTAKPMFLGGYVIHIWKGLPTREDRKRAQGSECWPWEMGHGDDPF